MNNNNTTDKIIEELVQTKIALTSAIELMNAYDLYYQSLDNSRKKELIKDFINKSCMSINQDSLKSLIEEYKIDLKNGGNVLNKPIDSESTMSPIAAKLEMLIRRMAQLQCVCAAMILTQNPGLTSGEVEEVIASILYSIKGEFIDQQINLLRKHYGLVSNE